MALVAVGVGLVALWSEFAALYVPQCPTFSIDAVDARCRVPVFWVLGGYLVAGAGTLLLLYELFRFLRRRSVGGQHGSGSA